MESHSISANESTDSYNSDDSSSGDSNESLGLNIIQNLDLIFTNQMDSNQSSEDSIADRRQCWLCLGQEEVSATADRQSVSSLSTDGQLWLSPCRCRGTAKWIHNECLQLWIDEKQKLDTSVAVKCSQCNTQYVLVFPPNGKLIDVILWYESVVNNVSTYAMVLCIAGAVYMSAFSYGVLTCLQILGAERTSELIENSNKSLSLIGLPSIPFILCAGKLINWENMVLRLWRRHYRKIPLISFFTG
ncbi:unnamed protein product, partial [Oppiella nova]